MRSALRQGRPSTTDIVPGTVLRHFLYKSKGNVQFVMPAYEPEYGTLLARRRSAIDHSSLMASLISIDSYPSTIPSTPIYTSRTHIFESSIAPVPPPYPFPGPRHSLNSIVLPVQMQAEMRLRKERIRSCNGCDGKKKGSSSLGAQ